MPFFEANDGMSLYYVDGGTGKPMVFVASACPWRWAAWAESASSSNSALIRTRNNAIALCPFLLA